MGTSKKYGNDSFWCFDDEHGPTQIAIWKGIKDGECTVIASAHDKYEAHFIVDALIKYGNDSIHNFKLGKKELTFLEFVQHHCVEPYSTMAGNAILWNDFEAYKNLIEKFPVIYS